MLIKNKCIFALAVMSVASCVLADNKAELAIKGKIIPQACNMAIEENGGVLDYGTITAGRLNETTETPLKPKQMTVVINCPTPAKVAFYAEKNGLEYLGPTSFYIEHSDYSSDAVGSKFLLKSTDESVIGTISMAMSESDKYAFNSVIDSKGNASHASYFYVDKIGGGKNNFAGLASGGAEDFFSSGRLVTFVEDRLGGIDDALPIPITFGAFGVDISPTINSTDSMMIKGKKSFTINQTIGLYYL